MKYILTLISIIFFSFQLFAKGGPEVYKRISSRYHNGEIIIAYNTVDNLPKTNVHQFHKENQLNFGGVNVDIYESNNATLAYIKIGTKAAWTYLQEGDNINTIIRELIVVTHNN
ncbi:hypothetical protein [Flammeovirga sp. SJP92]|uniref:hypothetical protein n=1 Tax=Flammeovirga sp. SJP92 TaxID=1775430 RepID=UPI00078950B2|nr:hypothetical protein [Flammeovirga sp. SJP92]KXX69996.1 hypothetical protein AVL50_14055 [Flammeovirga sp. SJP92]